MKHTLSNAMSANRLSMRQNVVVTTLATLLALLVPAAATAQNTQTPALAPQSQRTVDTVIHRDNGVYRDTQERIKLLNDGGIRVADYHLSKAQCWLDVSFHEYTRNDRGQFPKEALAESQRILTALENKQNPGLETPLVNGAQKIRPDLWSRYDAIKAHSGYACATQLTACGEVELVHAGNEINEAGWRHAKPYVQIAEDTLGSAEKSAASCARVAVAAPAPVEPAPVPPMAIPEKITLSADALFYFDKSATKDLLPKGRAELDELVQKIGTGKTGVKALLLIGYTDRLGTVPYNQRLSESRANTVKAYLQTHGVTVPIATEGRGLKDQLVPCNDLKPSVELRACLQPNRRVEVIVIR